jgi:hypothetical protein
MPKDPFDQKLHELEHSVAEVERRLTGDGLEAARALVSAVLAVHRDALEDFVEASCGADPARLASLANRPKIAWLLGLHGLNREPLAERAEAALRLAADVVKGANAEVVAVEGERVKVRVRAGAAEASVLLERAIERAMLGVAPEAALEFESESPRAAPRAPELLPAEQLVRRRTVPSP